MSSEKKVCWLLFFLGLAGLLFLCQKRGLSPESVGETNKQASQGIGQTRPKSDLDEALKRYAANSRADPHYDWKQPINFFGRVVDENDQSVSGAHVNFSWTDISANGTSEATTSSGPSGEFFLLNRTGKLLTVGVGKPGYYTTRDSNHPSFEYANPADGFFVPDPNNPVVFRLQKMGKAEPLVCSRHLWGFKADGTQYYLDLVAGKKFTERPPAWDIAVRFVRSASNQEKKFDWSMVLEASGGGLIETNPAVQEVNFARTHYQAHMAIMASRNGYTRAAKEAAKTTGVHLFSLKDICAGPAFLDRTKKRDH